jgi:hypothetical protein
VQKRRLFAVCAK